MNQILERIEENPVISAIRSESDIDAVLASQVTTVFILHADIFNVQPIVEKIKSSGRSALIHLDFLEGLGRDNKAIDYISAVIKPDGIITTRSSQVKYAKEKGIFVIQRFFLIDSLSYDTTIKSVQSLQPDMIEVMPGVMPVVIKKLCNKTNIPVIAGGLIDTKEEIIEILKAGAIGASTGKKDLWVL